jgi:hypothetical protein
VRQAWTIAKIELRRAFLAKRGLWVYALAILPAVIFFGHGLDAKWRMERLSRRGLTDPAAINSVQKGETLDAVKARLGTPAEERGGTRLIRARKKGQNGVTTHVVDSPVDARYVRLNITRPTYGGRMAATIYEFEVYGAEGGPNLALGSNGIILQQCCEGDVPGEDPEPLPEIVHRVPGFGEQLFCFFRLPLDRRHESEAAEGLDLKPRIARGFR